MKNEYRHGILLRLTALIISLLVTVGGLLCPVCATSDGGEDNITAKYIRLVAPDIKTGESMVKIGETKYVRYSITLEEYKTCYYSDIEFDVKYDDTALELYATNIQLGQIYAYDLINRTEALTQNSIVWYEPELIGSSVNFSTYSNTGMWFHGPVIILYFLIRDTAKVGDICNVTVSGVSINMLDADGNPEASSNYNISSKSGKITVTDEKSFIEGETVHFEETTSPFHGRGKDDRADKTTQTGFWGSNAPLAYAIAAIVLILIAGVVVLGVLKIHDMLKCTRLPEEKPQDGQQAPDEKDDHPGNPG